jgi:guanosine-3',5'-bis(diphosphate) 3'-pyrophosphohydrolase
MYLKDDEVSSLFKAIRFASEKHKRQRRKDSEASPYVNHPIAVAEILWRVGHVRDFVTIIAGILHDTIEDTNTKPNELEKEFSKEIRSVVEEVTDNKSLPKAERKQLQIENSRYKSTPAKLIKLADKICNIKDIIESPPSDWSIDRKKDYINWAQEVVNQIRGTNTELEKYFDNLCSDAVHLTENRKYPKFDRGNFKLKRQTDAYNEGTLSTGRPFRVERWFKQGFTFLSYFMSTSGIEDLNDAELKSLLVSEGLIIFDDEKYLSSGYSGINVDTNKITDDSGNEMWRITVIFSDEAGTTYVRNHFPLENAGKSKQPNNLVFN